MARATAWIRVACVCRAWRTLALAHPSLWARTTVGPAPAATQLVLARARCSALHVVCYLPPATAALLVDAHLAAVLASHLPQIRTLDVRVSSREDPHAVHHSPALRKLYASAVPAPRVHTLSYTGPHHSSFAPCELWDTPALHTVAISSTTSPASPVLPFQHTPSLTRFAYTTARAADPHDLLAGLRHMPGLVHLDLAVAESPCERAGGLVRLPKLRVLTLRGCPAHCEAFASCLAAPPGLVRVVVPAAASVSRSGAVYGHSASLGV